MKKIFAILLFFLLTGCSSEPSDIRAPIQGVWEAPTGLDNVKYYYVFNEDETYQGYRIAFTGPMVNVASSIKGTYDFSNGTVLFDPESGGDYRYHVAYLDEAQLIYSIGDAQLVCTKIPWEVFAGYIGM